MLLEFLEATVSDANQLAAVMSKAYADEPIISQLMPASSPPDALDSYWAGWLQVDMPKGGEEMIKVIDTATGYAAFYSRVSMKEKMREM